MATSQVSLGGESPAFRVFLPRAGEDTSRIPRANLVTRAAFFLLVASIPFESPIRILPYDVPTLLGALFLATTILSPRQSFGRLPGALWFFAGFFYIYAMSFVLNGGAYGPEVWNQFLPLLQLVLIFWVSCNLLRDERTADAALLLFIMACAILAVMQLGGLAQAPADFGGGIQRASVLGQNPNRTSRILAIGALAVIGLAFLRTPVLLRSRIVASALIALLVTAMLHGGSRGGLLTLLGAVCVIAATGSTLRARLRNGAVALVLLVAATVAALQMPLMRERLERAESGDLAKREVIFPTALSMFQERPLTGWGPVANQYELAIRLPEQQRETRDTHNLLLELITATGMFGAAAFLLGLLACTVSAWRARRGRFGILPFALVVALLLGNTSGNFLNFKIYWFVLAFAVAANAVVVVGSRPGRFTGAGSNP